MSEPLPIFIERIDKLSESLMDDRAFLENDQLDARALHFAKHHLEKAADHLRRAADAMKESKTP